MVAQRARRCYPGIIFMVMPIFLEREDMATKLSTQSLTYRSFSNEHSNEHSPLVPNRTFFQRVSDGFKSLGNLLCFGFESPTFNNPLPETKKVFSVSASIRIPQKPYDSLSKGPDGIFMPRSSS